MSSAFFDLYDGYTWRSSSLSSHEEKGKSYRQVQRYAGKKQSHFQSKGTKIERRATTRFTVWFITFHKYFENQSLFYRCRQLKNVGKLFYFWFFNNTLNVKLIEKGPVTKIFHVIDIENLLQAHSIEELINNSSS